MIFSQKHFEEPQYHETANFEIYYFTAKNPLKDSVNEDSLGFYEVNKNILVLYVADGAGGHPKGEDASRLALECLETSLAKYKDKSESNLRFSILNGIEKGNELLLSNGVGSKTTLTVCSIDNDKVRSYQVGDSGLIVCGQKGKFKYKTISHSPVGYGVEAGLITEDEALTHPNLNEVDNIMGEADMRMDIGPEVAMQSKDTIVIASDGLLDNFSTEQIIEKVRCGQLKETAEQIVQYFREKLKSDPDGTKVKYDDLSFILCRKK